MSGEDYVKKKAPLMRKCWSCNINEGMAQIVDCLHTKYDLHFPEIGLKCSASERLDGHISSKKLNVSSISD